MRSQRLRCKGQWKSRPKGGKRGRPLFNVHCFPRSPAKRQAIPGKPQKYICLFEQSLIYIFSIQEKLEKSIKIWFQNQINWTNYTKSVIFTMETIPNCTTFRRKKPQKKHQKWLQGAKRYAILNKE